MNWRRFAALIVTASLVLAGCQGAQPTSTNSKEEPAKAAAPVGKLKIGILPIVDVLPMHVAVQEGLFQKHQVDVELVPFQSALERDVALQSGNIDGELNDLVSASLLNKDAERIKIIRRTHQGASSMAMMVVLASPGSSIRSAADLKNVEIGVSKNSVIEYSTDRMLTEAGLRPNEISKVEVTQIPVRAEMLAKNQIQAATLPEPLASLAVQQGARVIVDDSKTGIGESVLSFLQEKLKGNPEGVRRFLLAYEDAVAAINTNPEKYRDLMIEKANVPAALRPTIKLPRYPTASVPGEKDVQAVMDWLVGKQMIPAPIPYGTMVDASFLPKR